MKRIKVKLTIEIIDADDEKQLARREFEMCGDMATVSEIRIEPAARMAFYSALDDTEERYWNTRNTDAD